MIADDHFQPTKEYKGALLHIVSPLEGSAKDLDEMSVHGYHGGFDSDDDYYSPSEEGSPWVLEREIGKGGFGLVKLYINQVKYISLLPPSSGSSWLFAPFIWDTVDSVVSLTGSTCRQKP